MTTTDDLTTTILRQIRDEIITTRTDLASRIDATNERLDTAIGRIDATKERVDTLIVRVDATNERLDTAIGRIDERFTSVEQKLDRVVDEVAGIGRYAKNISRRHDRAIGDLRERVARLEARKKN